MSAEISVAYPVPDSIFLGVDGVQTKINKNVMTVVSISIMSYFFMAGMWNTCF